MNALTRTIVVGLICLILLGVVGYELYFIKGADTAVRSAIEKADEQIGNDSRARSIVYLQNNSVEELKIADEAILTKEELVTFVESLENMGREIGLSITISSIVKEGNKVSTSTPEVVRVAVDAKGPWEESIHFINLLENLPHKIYIDKLDFTTDAGEWRSSTIVRVTTYPEK